MPYQQINNAQAATNWVAQHSRYERYSYKQFKPALDEQVAPIIAHIKTYGGITDSVADMLVTKKPMETAYQSVYTKIGVQHAQYTTTQINRSLRKSFISDTWRSLMQKFFTNNSASRVSDVTETTRAQIRKVLADSTDLPTSQRASYITDTLGADDFNRNRALMIARTESTTAANQGAMLAADSSDYEVGKQWGAILDRNTRPDHVDANGQLVGMDEQFIVGGFSCDYPGDMALPANECVNCRCFLQIVPMLSETGMPVLKDTA